jgi:hypothetical protein
MTAEARGTMKKTSEFLTPAPPPSRLRFNSFDQRRASGKEDPVNKHFFTVLLASIVGLMTSGCWSNPGESTCSKIKECCSKTSSCEESSQEGYEDRCSIGYDSLMDTLGTYDRDECSKIADAADEYFSCLSDVSCDEVGQDGRVSKCDSQARALCRAGQDATDACGGMGYIHHIDSCDSEEAYLRFSY